MVSNLIHSGMENASRPVSRVLSRAFPPMDDHSSGTPVAGRFARPTRMAGPETALAPAGAAPSLFGLAPGGVCPAAAVAGSAVRSCRTISPLRQAKARSAVSFLWHCPWGRPRRALPGTVFPWSPDFPPPRPFGTCGSGHPASWRAGGRRWAVGSQSMNPRSLATSAKRI